MPSDPRVRLAMDALARTLNEPTTAAGTLRVLTDGAVHAIPGASDASISILHRDGKLETVAATDPLIDELDAHQYQLKEGPCYETVTSETFHVTFDLANDPRWPTYAPFAAEHGMRGQLAVLLSRNGTGRSALNVYASRTRAFDHESIEVAELFASHAAVAMGFVRTIENLNEAIGSRQVIGQAIGIVMERYQIDEERAFSFLVRISRDSNVKLRTVAADFVAGAIRRNELSLELAAHAPPPNGR